MDFNLLFKKAKEANIEALEVYAKKLKGMSFEFFANDESFNIEDSYEASIRGIYNGKMGMITIENLNDFSIDEIINTIKENATLIENNEEVFIYEGDNEYPTDDTLYVNLDSITTKQKKDLIKNAKQLMQEKDKRIVEGGSSYKEQDVEIQILNSKGLNLSKKFSFYYVVLQSIANNGTDTKVNYEVYLKNDFSFCLKEKVDELVSNTVSKLNAKSILSGNYDIIIKNKTFAEILGAFKDIFSGLSAKDNLTLLKDKVNETIGNELCTIIDDPLYPDFGLKQVFDDEGVACYKKEIVKNGVLKTLLHNLKTAKIFNTKTTGNGFKAGISSPVSIDTTTFYLENGKKDFNELVKELNNGLIIDDVQGLHAGLNEVSGDFNLQAQGFKVENGKITEPVTLIIISSNIYDIFKNIVDKANDLDFTTSQTGSPSILLKNIKISGE